VVVGDHAVTAAGQPARAHGPDVTRGHGAAALWQQVAQVGLPPPFAVEVPGPRTDADTGVAEDPHVTAAGRDHVGGEPAVPCAGDGPCAAVPAQRVGGAHIAVVGDRPHVPGGGR